MAEVRKSESTKSRDLMDARLEAILTEPIVWPYPEKVTLVPTDEPHAATTIIDAAREGKSMVLFFPDGEEIVLTASTPRDSGQR